MLAVAKERSESLGITVTHVSKVSGTFDMPIIVAAMLKRDDIDGVVTLGAVIKGQTRHDEVIAHSTARALVDLAIQFQKPVSLGVSGPGMQQRQAYARIRPVAERAVEAVLKTSQELDKIRS